MYGQKQLGRGGINELTTGLQDNRTVTEQAHRHSSPCVCVCTEILILDTLLSQTRLLQSTLRSCPHRMRHVRVCKAVSCVYLRYSRVPGPASWLFTEHALLVLLPGRRHASHAARQHRTAPLRTLDRRLPCSRMRDTPRTTHCRPMQAARGRPLQGPNSPKALQPMQPCEPSGATPRVRSPTPDDSPARTAAHRKISPPQPTAAHRNVSPPQPKQQVAHGARAAARMCDPDGLTQPQ